MKDEDSIQFSETQLAAAFAKLFPPEYWNTIALGELAPLGWEQSPLRVAFHPSVQQVFEESLHAHRTLAGLRKPDAPALPEPTLAEIMAGFQETPIEAEREVHELLGRCMWDIFSDNHEVLAPQGRVFDIGSFRGAGGFIANYLNEILGKSQYDYMDFYLGTHWVAGRVDLTSVYVLIFRRLKDHGFDWVYHFPRLALIDMRPLRDALADKTKPEWLDYSPEEAFAREHADVERDAEIAAMRESLDRDYRAMVDRARRSPPPATVLAYRAVYHTDPRGWPPTADAAD